MYKYREMDIPTEPPAIIAYRKRMLKVKEAPNPEKFRTHAAKYD